MYCSFLDWRTRSRTSTHLNDFPDIDVVTKIDGSIFCDVENFHLFPLPLKMFISRFPAWFVRRIIFWTLTSEPSIEMNLALSDLLTSRRVSGEDEVGRSAEKVHVILAPSGWDEEADEEGDEKKKMRDREGETAETGAWIAHRIGEKFFGWTKRRWIGNWLTSGDDRGKRVSGTRWGWIVWTNTGLDEMQRWASLTRWLAIRWLGVGWEV